MAGEEAGRPVLGAVDRSSPVIVHDHIARHVLVFGPQSVGQPGTNGGMADSGHTAVHLNQGGSVVVGIAVAALQEGHVVYAGCQVRELLGDPLTGLAVPLEPVWRLHQSPNGLLTEKGHEILRGGLPVHLVQNRLGLEQIDPARSSVHEQKDTGGGFGSEMRGLRGQRVGVAATHDCVWKSILAEHAGQAEKTEPCATAAQKVTAAKELRLNMRLAVSAFHRMFSRSSTFNLQLSTLTDGS